MKTMLFKYFSAAKMLGPRIGRWDDHGKEPAMGSATNAIIGCFMIWWAWVAFNQVMTLVDVVFTNSEFRDQCLASVARDGSTLSEPLSPPSWHHSLVAWWASSTV